MNKKHFSLLLIAVFLCCTIVACSDDDPQPATSTTQTESGPAEEPESTDEPDDIKESEYDPKTNSVTLKEAGDLSTTLGDYMLSITSLKIIGPLNGDDICCLRQMLGGVEFSTIGNLATLDLSDAYIVKGGSSYYTNIDNSYLIYYTYDNAIGTYMFYNCKNLETIVLPNSVTEIGSWSFESCQGITEITIPNSVTVILNHAFRYCTGLTSVTIPNSVTEIEQGAFDGCTGLTEITIPNAVTSIGVGAFDGCSSLTSVTIPNSVTEIGLTAFRGCTSLTEVTIGNSVTTIGEEAFVGCEKLMEINSKNPTPPTIQNYAFDDVSETVGILYVPIDCKEKYSTADGWKRFSNIQEKNF